MLFALNTPPSSSIETLDQSSGELRVRISAELAAHIGLRAGDLCEVSVQNGRIVIAPASVSAWRELEKLLTEHA
jgi:antitoxin component of MazEF toxin-antitoxin module